MQVKEIESSFPSPVGHNSCAYWIPMNLIDEVQAAYKTEGIKIACRYRGPRSNQVGISMRTLTGSFYYRHRMQANQQCLKEFATHFCVYRR